MTDKTPAPCGSDSSTELGGRTCEQGCNGCDDCTDFDEPKCDRCGAPITTGMMALMCPHGRQCTLVDGDEHWQTVEELRVDFGIERVKLPNTNSGTDPVA